MGCCPPIEVRFPEVLFPSLRVPAPPMYHRRGEVAIKKASAKPAGLAPRQFQLFEEFAALGQLLFPQLFEEFAIPFPPAFRGVCNPFPPAFRGVCSPWPAPLPNIFEASSIAMGIPIAAQSSQKTSVNLLFVGLTHSFPTLKSFSNQSFLCICQHFLHVDQIYQNLTELQSFLKHFNNCIGEKRSLPGSLPAFHFQRFYQSPNFPKQKMRQLQDAEQL